MAGKTVFLLAAVRDIAGGPRPRAVSRKLDGGVHSTGQNGAAHRALPFPSAEGSRAACLQPSTSTFAGRRA